jgi:hypothetical protein
MNNKRHIKSVLFFKPGSAPASKLGKGVLLAAFCALFILSALNLNAQLCRTTSWYDSWSWTWSYAGPCTDEYNCLAYALGITDECVWPWGSNNPNQSQVSSYLYDEGYSVSGSDAKIISYGPSSDSITHFSRVTGPSTCRAKWGDLNLIDHGSWDPYYSYTSYGSKRMVYYQRYLSVSIDGPTQISPDTFCMWCADVSYGTPPYSYQWYYNPLGGSRVDMGTGSCAYNNGIVDVDGYIDVVVRDSAGQQKSEYIYVDVSSGGGGPESNDLQSVSRKEQIAAHLFDLLDEAAAKNMVSSNPYDYIKTRYYRRIVAMGPIALMTIREMILTSTENGLKEYILAIAAEDIAQVDLKGDSFAWATAKEFCRRWDDHIGQLPQSVANILRSGQSISAKNNALVKLGIPAIPFIIDEIARGKHELTDALNTLAKGAGKKKGESLDAWKKKHADTLTILRNLAAAYKK